MEICGRLEVIVKSLITREIPSIYICAGRPSIAKQVGIISNISNQNGFRKFKQLSIYWLNQENMILV